MRKIIGILIALGLFVCHGYTQNEHFVGFNQVVEVAEYVGLPFKVEAAVKMQSDMSVADIAIWTRTHKADHTAVFLKKSESTDYQPTDQWQVHTIEGTIDEGVTYLQLGGYCAYNGQFYFDAYKLSVKKGGTWMEVPLENGGFENTTFEKVTYAEKTYDKPMIKGWKGFIVHENRKTFTPKAVREEVYAGKSALLIEGKGYFYAPELLKKYVGEWEIEFVPELSENAIPDAMVKGTFIFESIGAGYGLKETSTGIQKLGGPTKPFHTVGYTSYHPSLNKVFSTGFPKDEPPLGMSEGTLDSLGNMYFTEVSVEQENTPTTWSYEWKNEHEIANISKFTGVQGAPVTLYYRMKRMRENATEVAIKALLHSETTAYINNDMEAWQRHWHPSEDASMLITGGGMQAKGWKEIQANFQSFFEGNTNPIQFELSNSNYTFHIQENQAYVTYEQTMTYPYQTTDGEKLSFQSYEIRNLVKVNDQWKIVNMVNTPLNHANAPNHTIEHLRTAGRQLFQSGNSQAALQLAKLTTEWYPELPAGYFGQGFYYFQLKDKTNALKYLEKALSILPDDPSLREWYQKAKAL